MSKAKPEDAPVRIFMLGRFAVEYQGEAVEQSAWSRKRPVELLTALALAQGHLLHREEVIDRLWPGKDLEAGANNLYRTLHTLRKITGEDVVSMERGVVRLADNAWTDVTAFEAAVAAGDCNSLAKAVELYRGDLLPDDPYSDALIARREGLRQRFVDAALGFAKSTESTPEQRVETLRRVVELDPTIERAQRMLMTTLANMNRPKEALRQFAECVKAMRAQLDSEPSSKTLELGRQIKEGEFVPTEAEAPAAVAKSPSAATPLPQTDAKVAWETVSQRILGTNNPPRIRGREDLVAKLAGAIECGTLLLAGEAGVGKTRLALEFAQQCYEKGASVLAGMGYEFEGIAPYTPFVDAWSQHLRACGLPESLNPFLSFQPVPGASAQEDRLRMFQAVERSIVELAGNGTVCVLIEDLHWADESSLHLLHHLARATRHLPLQIVATFREEEVTVGQALHTLIAGLDRERLAKKFVLKRLDLAASRALIADLAGKDLGDRVTNKIFDLADGNPFFTEELVRSYADGEELSVSDNLLDQVRTRVSRLGGDAERLFAASAVQGIRFDFDVARAAANMDAGDALDALDLGLTSRVVEEHDGRYRFHHALIQHALYSSLSHARRVFLHRATVEVLEDDKHPSRAANELLAYHHQEAGQIHNALPYLIAAAKTAQSRLGFGEAVDFFERAIKLMDALGVPAGPERLEALKNMGGMRVALGDLEQAVQDLEAVVALHRKEDDWRPSSVDRANALRIMALAHIEGGQLEKAETALDSALACLASDDEPTIELSNLLYLFAQLRWHQSRHAEAFEMAEKCLKEAEQHNDQQALAKGYEMLALACHSLGEWRKGTEFEERRQSLADGTLDVASAFDVHL